MVKKPFDLEKLHPLFPRPEILAEYAKVNGGDNEKDKDKQGIQYERTVQDRGYEQWHYMVKGRPVYQEVTQIYRRRVTGEGEFLLYNLELTGTDWKGNEQTFSTLLGRYEKPIFRLEKNPETQEISSTQISSHKTVYDIPYTRARLDELLDMASEPISLVVYGTAGRRLGLQSIEDYRNGNIEDLIVCSNKGKSLEAVLVEKNQFTYEKRESSSSRKKVD